MRKKTSFKASSAKFRARYRRGLAARQRAEEREWAAKSGPVKIYFRDPPLDAATQGEYAGDGAAGSASS